MIIKILVSQTEPVNHLSAQLQDRMFNQLWITPIGKTFRYVLNPSCLWLDKFAFLFNLTQQQPAAIT